MLLPSDAAPGRWQWAAAATIWAEFHREFFEFGPKCFVTLGCRRRVGTLSRVHMHDYYPIIARAVSRLETNTPKARRELFDRIRRILTDQLRIREPPPTDADFRRECAALEKAIHRVEVEWATSDLPTTEPADVLSVKRDTAGVHRVEHSVEAKDLGRRQAVDRDRAGVKPINTRANREHQQDTSSAPRPNPIADPIQQAGLAWPGLGPHDPSPSAAPDQSARTTLVQAGIAANPKSKDEIHCMPFSRASDLYSIHCLDELLQSGAEPLAPESLRRDSNAILKWLGVPNAKKLNPTHYEQFTRALRTYMMECENPAVRQAPRTITSSLAIDDAVRAIFDRVLEREQAAVVFDDVLTWFVTIWIGSVLALNLIVGVILVIAAPTIAAGFANFAATYSPFNFWCWVCQAFAISPAVIAVYVKRERLREKEDEHRRAGPGVGDARYRQTLRPGEGRMDWRSIFAYANRRLRSQSP